MLRGPGKLLRIGVFSNKPGLAIALPLDSSSLSLFVPNTISLTPKVEDSSNKGKKKKNVRQPLPTSSDF